jgi:hypothetical protein
MSHCSTMRGQLDLELRATNKESYPAEARERLISNPFGTPSEITTRQIQVYPTTPGILQKTATLPLGTLQTRDFRHETQLQMTFHYGNGLVTGTGTGVIFDDFYVVSEMIGMIPELPSIHLG